MNDPAIIDEMLRTAKTIAVVGMSDKTWRASHNIGRYLAEKATFPSIPRSARCSACTCYPDLDAAQAAAREQTGDGNRPGRRLSRLGVRAGHRGRCDPARDSLPLAAGRRHP